EAFRPDPRRERIEPHAAVCARRRAGAARSAEAVERVLHVADQDVLRLLQVFGVAVRQRDFPLEFRAAERPPRALPPPVSAPQPPGGPPPPAWAGRPFLRGLP